MRLVLTCICVAVAALTTLLSLAIALTTAKDTASTTTTRRQLGLRSDIASEVATGAMELVVNKVVGDMVEKDEIRRTYYFRARRQLYREYWSRAPVSARQFAEEQGELELMKRQKEAQLVK